MGAYLFDHADKDEDRLRIWNASGGLWVETTHALGVVLDREAVQNLHTALGVWLHGVPAPVERVQSGTGDVAGAIRMVAEAIGALALHLPPVAEVLPLHQSPMARYEDASAPKGPCTLSEPLMRPLTDKCGECGGLWGLHLGVQEKIERGLRTPTDPGRRPKGPCTQKIPYGAYLSDQHAECGYLWALHTPSAPKCGQCGAPWNDGHGQPGDPCIRTCDECTHPADRHGKGGCGWVVRDDHGVYCRCTWEPGATVPKQRSSGPCFECGHAEGDHTFGYGIEGHPCGVSDCECTRYEP